MSSQARPRPPSPPPPTALPRPRAPASASSGGLTVDLASLILPEEAGDWHQEANGTPRPQSPAKGKVAHLQLAFAKIENILQTEPLTAITVLERYPSISMMGKP